jgi:hypothetical protein
MLSCSQNDESLHFRCAATVKSLLRRLLGTEISPQIADAAAAAIEIREPSHQNAVDLVSGWNHAFPGQYALKAGHAVLYNDPRILWAVEQFGSLTGKRVLELGPLEAFHTSMLDQHDPAVLDAVEANVAAYLRCLITKQVLDLGRAKFHLGNFIPWLERDDVMYDLIVACGVLYHMSDPIHLLDMMSRRADAIYLWTHYFDRVAMPPDDPRGSALTNRTQVIRHGELSITLHGRRYYGAERNLVFCGGPEDLHYWMEKTAIVEVLLSLGFDDVRLNHDQPEHPNGPAVSIFAQRSTRGVS